MSASIPPADGQLPLAAPQPLPPGRRRKRLKVDVACDRCRSRKVKCDGARPACGNCSRKLDLGDKCHYGASSIISPNTSGNAPSQPGHDKERLNRNARPSVSAAPAPPPVPWQQPRAGIHPTHRPIAARPASTSSGLSQSRSSPRDVRTTHTVDSMTAVGDETTTEFFGSSSAGSFTAQIKAAVDSRLGHSPNSLPVGTHGTGNAQAPRLASRRRNNPKSVLLPTRRLADELMRTYWLYIDPLYPFLNRGEWQDRYNRLFAGQALDTDEAVFMASLNIVFALSTQLHEGQDAAVRNDTSQDYFQRAQDLVDVTIWDSGSLEVVQYLLITSQYLQSTNSPHQTWMVVGLVVRTAQSLGLHLPETSAAKSSASEKELYRKLWHGCVLMDRMVALTHGRPAMISAELASCVPLPTIAEETTQIPDDSTDVAFFVKSVELYEITQQLVERLYSTPTGRTQRMKPSQRAVSDLANIVQIDGDMSEWENSLPKQLQQHTLGTIAARPSIILRLRFLHARILLLRPILSLVCLPHATTESDTERLSNRLHKQCALECVATARATIRIFFDHQVSDGTVGLLPAWWYRLYYLFSASTVLIAAKLRPDVFPADDINESWEQAIHVFETLQHVSQSAQKCVTALRILSTKILSTIFGAPQPDPGTQDQSAMEHPRMNYDFPSNANIQKSIDGFDFNLNFEDINFDVETENYAWLNEVTSWNFLSG
ncbi:Fungal specific transcription factor [Cordyceps fumosorosea ARSEF 2679]|uniref:Fungal specific transcription factor n=1 Tax=Cordyceps fumosorosea (strain ARSEF 2679) TaxID=1081104 RepID=A0A167SV34_CORFA|nr:Fungal specific transcription factor [Cordyceps fumosorosea ARSEF 2679]OAA59953.1 Fungal specific transcription factor [Cordyceps fumosorosea ARSEF 2679]